MDKAVIDIGGKVIEANPWMINGWFVIVAVIFAICIYFVYKFVMTSINKNKPNIKEESSHVNRDTDIFMTSTNIYIQELREDIKNIIGIVEKIKDNQTEIKFLSPKLEEMKNGLTIKINEQTLIINNLITQMINMVNKLNPNR